MDEEDEIRYVTCMACNTSMPEEFIILHQADCRELPEEKRQYRRSVAFLMYGSEVDTLIAQVQMALLSTK